MVEKADSILQLSLGCLASGLAFIHQQTIRHKDIKPQNILIHHGSVMYTDFGLSYDFGDSGQSTTTGLVQGLTRRYCAPEVAASGNRNSKSDIFSLGCVYLEILDTLSPGIVSEDVLTGPFHETLHTEDGESFCIHSNDSSFWQPEMEPIEALLHPNPSHRPSASKLVQTWLTLRTPMYIEKKYFCTRCISARDVQSSSR